MTLFFLSSFGQSLVAMNPLGDVEQFFDVCWVRKPLGQRLGRFGDSALPGQAERHQMVVEAPKAHLQPAAGGLIGYAVNFEVESMPEGADLAAVEGCKQAVGGTQQARALPEREQSTEIDRKAVARDDMELDRVELILVRERRRISHDYPRGKNAANCIDLDNGGILVAISSICQENNDEVSEKPRLPTGWEAPPALAVFFLILLSPRLLSLHIASRVTVAKAWLLESGAAAWYRYCSGHC